MERLELTPRVRALRVSFSIPLANGTTLPRSVYAWFLLGERLLLIDSGVAGAGTTILAAIDKAGRRPVDLAALLLTHAHPDHIGSAARLRQATGCRLLAPAAERAWIEDTGLQERRRPVPGFRRSVAGAVHLDQCLADGDALPCPPLGELRVLQTPGHSPGSLSFWLPSAGLTVEAGLVPAPRPVRPHRSPPHAAATPRDDDEPGTETA